MKKKLGYKFETTALILSYIDDLAYKLKINGPGVNKKLSNEWKKPRPNESYHYRHARIQILIQLVNYLKLLGIKSYEVRNIPYKPNDFIPYIFSPEEIQDLFKICDSRRMKQKHPKGHLISFPIAIRTLYATGIRIGELKNLKNQDVDLRNKTLLILDNKNQKERLIPISDSLNTELKKYLKFKHAIPIKKQSDYFFVNHSGKKCNAFYVNFKDCVKEMNLQLNGSTNIPRIHDLRHTFAVSAIAKMAEQGLDIYTSLPILSNYLGHQSIDSTNKYVRLTASMYPELINKVDKVTLDILPKFRNYEDY